MRARANRPRDTGAPAHNHEGIGTDLAGPDEPGLDGSWTLRASVARTFLVPARSLLERGKRKVEVVLIAIAAAENKIPAA